MERSPRRPNTISGGFGVGGPSHSGRKRHLRAIKSVNMIGRHTWRSMPDIIFIDRDFKSIGTWQDDPMVIAIKVGNYEIRKTLVDLGSSVDVLYLKTLKKMWLDEDAIIPLDEQTVGFLRERVDTKSYVDLYAKFGRAD